MVSPICFFEYVDSHSSFTFTRCAFFTFGKNINKLEAWDVKIDIIVEQLQIFCNYKIFIRF